MSIVDDFLKQVGDSGLPEVVDPSIKDTWEAYHKSNTPETLEDRVLDVLGFFYLVRQAGMKRLIKMPKSDPAVIYKAIRQEEFEVYAEEIAKQLVKYHVLDILRVYKSKFDTILPVRGDNRTFKFDLCLEPKRKEPLDSALTKLQGMMYTSELPSQMREVWKKHSVTSVSKPKSALPTYSRIMSNPSVVGFVPLYVNNTKKSAIAIYAKRSAGDMLVLRITASVTAKPVSWLTPRMQVDVLKAILSKAFLKLKG